MAKDRTIAMIKRTSDSSSRVKPAGCSPDEWCTLRVFRTFSQGALRAPEVGSFLTRLRSEVAAVDIGILAVAAIRAVGTERLDHRAVAVGQIDVRIAPRINWHLVEVSL